MASIIKEPMSPRGDHSVLVWNAGEVFSIPFHFDIKQKFGSEIVDFEIPSSWKIKIFIKDDLKHTQPILTFTYADIVKNTIYLTMSTTNTMKMRGGRTYNLNARLYDHNNIQQKILINNLPIRILEG